MRNLSSLIKVTIVFQRISKFLVESFQIYSSMREVEGDNPFGPVCDCNVCLKNRVKISYCTDCRPRSRQRANKRRKRSFVSCRHPVDFKLIWKPAIPCEYCHKDECSHKFLDSLSCFHCRDHLRGKWKYHQEETKRKRNERRERFMNSKQRSRWSEKYFRTWLMMHNIPWRESRQMNPTEE